jgi:predicted O-methyltransferase YrrM
MINKELKEILLKSLRKSSVIAKILLILKNSYITFKIIKKINLKYSIILIPKIISGNFFLIKNQEKINNTIYDEKIFYNKKYKFNYDDWFSKNIPVWQTIVKKIDKIKYLEIGSFEGRSTVFIAEQNNLYSITAVDPWEQGNTNDEISLLVKSNYSAEKIFENFKHNIKLIKKPNINYIKNTSDKFFINNENNYNLIYIDGSHEASQVKKDFVNAFNCLEKSGILICDDFIWFLYNDITKNPMKAILECYDKYKKNLRILFLGHQIIFQKM